MDDEHAAARLPRRRPGSDQAGGRAGPRNVISRVGTAAASTAGTALRDLALAATVARLCAVRDGRREQRRRRGTAEPEQPQAAQRLAPGDEPVGVVFGDLLGQVALELGHDRASS